MKTEHNILIAFILNLIFSVFEFIGGAVVGSVAIVSDAVHDLGDALSIGISYFLERSSKREPDEIFTYGYARLSVVGSLITTVVLLFGSVAVIYNAVLRLFNPVEIDYGKMIIFAVFGVAVNFLAAFVTKEGDSLNQKAVNLHMIEDVLGWVVVLVGAVVMHFTDWAFIDPLMSIGVSVFIFINAIKNLGSIKNLFLEKIPANINIEHVKEHLREIDGVEDVHHIHIWSMDGYNNYATMHIVSDISGHEIKEKIKEELKELGIVHSTLELETSGEHCHTHDCHLESCEGCPHHHHHHHHH